MLYTKILGTVAVLDSEYLESRGPWITKGQVTHRSHLMPCKRAIHPLTYLAYHPPHLGVAGSYHKTA